MLLAESLLPLTGFVTTVFLTRFLGPRDYGLFTLSASLVSLVQWLAIAPLASAPVKIVREAQDWRPVASALLRAHAALGCIAVIVLLAGAPVLAIVFDEPALVFPLLLLAPEALVFTLAAAHRQVLVGLGDYAGRAAAGAARWSARLVLVLALVGAGAGIPGAMVALIGASLAELLACRTRVQPSLFATGSFRLRSLAFELLPVAAFAACLRLFSNLDLFLMKALGASASETGMYGAALNVFHGVVLTGSAVTPLLLSSMAGQLSKGDVGAARGLARDGIRAGVLLFPFAALAAPCAGEIARLLFGPAYAASGQVLAVLGFAAVANLLLLVAAQMLIAANRPAWCALLGLALLAAGAVGVMVVAPRYGLPGVAWARTGVTAVVATFAVGLACRVLGAAMPWRSVAVAGVLGAGAWAASGLLPAAGLLVLVKVLVLSLALLLALFASGELGRAQVRALAAALSPQRRPGASG